MIVTLLAMLALLVVGGGAAGRMRTAALADVLERLPEEEARAFYERLRRGQRKVAVMRALALASLLCLFFVFRQRLAGPLTSAAHSTPATPATTSSPGRASSGSSPSAPAPPR